MERELKDKQIENCTFIKTILMLSVVLGHSVHFWTNDWFQVVSPMIKSEGLHLFSDWLNSFHIYGFVLVSGYLFYYLKYECGKYNDYKNFLINKGKRLLIPYIFTAALWVVPIATYFYKYGLVDIIKRYALGVSPSQLWFLLMLFWVFAIVHPLTEYIKKYNWCSIIVSLFIYLIGICGSNLFPNVFCIWLGLQNILYFVIGFKLRQNVREIKNGTVILMCFFNVICFIMGLSTEFSNNALIIYNFVCNLTGAIASFMLLQKIGERLCWEKNKLFYLLSKNSMMIYLFHQQIIYFVIIWLNGKINPYLHGALGFIISLMGALVISLVLQRFKITRFMFGEK